ncbi:MAG: hypothetical protein ACI4U0_00385 [Candidatus Aphodocola sp.]
MIAEKDIKENIDNILSGGNIEGKKIKQPDMLKQISKDKNLMHLFFLEFEMRYPYEDGLDMLFCKTEDFIYRLDMAINDWLIPMHNIKTYKEIKSTLMDLIFEDIDLYSAVSYDESDKEIIDEFESIFSNKEINI